MKRTYDAEYFEEKCPYTDKPCYEWECDTCEVEEQEKKDAEELDRAESEGVMTKKEEMLTEVLRKNRENMLEIIREESGKIELIHKEIAEYPAAVIPKKEALEIINRIMKGSKG